jgi:uncharacterized protein YdeI (YjbR/CyaY-like superfamily)
MPYNKQFDAYIARSADWAQPILTRIREIVHEACPDVEEEMKWSSPTFVYQGILCGMVAFKEHAAFHFWKGELVTGTPLGANGMGAAAQFGRMRSVKDLPPRKELVAYIKKAMKLNEAGVKVERPKKKRPALAMPDYFMAAIKRNKKALAAYEAFSPSHRREYIEWITDAKTDATRDKRVAQAVEWMAEGKGRNWKYQR